MIQVPASTPTVWVLWAEEGAYFLGILKAVSRGTAFECQVTVDTGPAHLGSLKVDKACTLYMSSDLILKLTFLPNLTKLKLWLAHSPALVATLSQSRLPECWTLLLQAGSLLGLN